MTEREIVTEPGGIATGAAARRVDWPRRVNSWGERLRGVLDARRLQFAAVAEREFDAGRGFLWLPVFLGTGIVIYFSLPREPSLVALLLLDMAATWGAWLARRRIVLFRTLLIAATVVAGTAVTKLRTDAVATPVLLREMTVKLTGWVADSEAAARGGVRILLRVHAIEGMAKGATPGIVRVTVRSKTDIIAVGDAIGATVRLQPPSGPVVPGGYDFSLAAFYEQIGGVGFAYGAVQPADIGPAPFWVLATAPLADLRQTLRRRIVSALAGDNGEIAAALIMGDQGGISQSAQEAMRASGLGHVLSISGLHMVLVAGSAFWLIRALLALSPGLALTRPIKKWAAAGGLVVASFYLLISGLGVATVRAYIMIAIMLLAILIDRRAITLRNVALAAIIILFVWPESLLSASFQMSFAATLALVAAYEALAERADRRLILTDAVGHGILSRVRLSVGSLVLTSLIAGLATTPFAIYHFQRAAPLSLLANLAAMPVVGVIVMPMALFAVVLMPFGLEAVPLTVMSYGLDWMMLVAHVTAAWSEGLGGVRMAPALSLLLFVGGFLWLCLWRERWRLAGLVPLLAAIPIALSNPRPDVFVAADGEAVAVRGADGVYRIIGGKDHRFDVENWLRIDGDQRDPKAALEADARCDGLGCVLELGGTGELVALANRPAAFLDDCRFAAVVVSRFKASKACREHTTVIDREALILGGAHALYRIATGPDGLRPSFRIEAAYPAHRRPFMPPIAGATQ